MHIFKECNTVFQLIPGSQSFHFLLHVSSLQALLFQVFVVTITLHPESKWPSECKAAEPVVVTSSHFSAACPAPFLLPPSPTSINHCSKFRSKKHQFRKQARLREILHWEWRSWRLHMDCGNSHLISVLNLQRTPEGSCSENQTRV